MVKKVIQALLGHYVQYILSFAPRRDGCQQEPGNVIKPRNMSIGATSPLQETTLTDTQIKSVMVGKIRVWLYKANARKLS